MATEVRSIGLKSIKGGKPATDGGMSTDLKPWGVTFRGSATLSSEAPTVTDFYSEENADPEESISERGLTSVEFDIINVDPVVLADLLGGEATGEGDSAIYNAPRDVVEVERSLQIITAYNVQIDIPRSKIIANINWPLSRTDIAKVHIRANVLTPTKAGLAPYSISKVQSVEP